MPLGVEDDRTLCTPNGHMTVPSSSSYVGNTEDPSKNKVSILEPNSYQSETQDYLKNITSIAITQKLPYNSKSS